MAKTHWSESFPISIPLLIDQAALRYIFEGVSEIAAERISLTLALSYGETLTCETTEDIETITNDQLVRTKGIDLYAQGSDCTVGIYLREATYPETYISVSSDTQNQVYLAKGLATEMERRFAAPSREGAFVTARPPVESALGPSDVGSDLIPPITEEPQVATIREVPSVLPHARLYVDDLEEIAKILISAATTTHTPNPKITLTSSTQVFPSFASMMQQGGISRDFTLSAGDRFISIRFFGFLRPNVSLSGVEGDAKWAAYSRIKAVFEPRAYHLKNAILGLPSWLKSVLYVVLLFAPSALPKGSKRAAISGLAAYALIACLICLELMRRSVVIFAKYQPHSRVLSERNRTYLVNLLFALLGAVASVMLQALYDHLKR